MQHCPTPGMHGLFWAPGGVPGCYLIRIGCQTTPPLPSRDLSSIPNIVLVIRINPELQKQEAGLADGKDHLTLQWTADPQR